MPLQKHFPLILLFSSIASYCKSQQNAIPSSEKNEVFLTLLSKKDGYGYLDESDYIFTFFNGLGYKRHIGRHTIRLSLNYKDDQHNFQYESYGNETYREGQINLGYQFNLVQKSVQPYIAVDLFYLIAKYESESHGGWWEDWYSMENLDKHGIGFGPAVGVKFLLPKSFSLTFEGNFEFLWIHSKGTITKNEYPDANTRNTYPEDRTDFSVLFNPLNIFSLNYDF